MATLRERLRACVARKIPALVHEGRAPGAQTVAIAFATCRRLGVPAVRGLGEVRRLTPRQILVRLVSVATWARSASRLAGVAKDLIEGKIRGSPSCANHLVHEAVVLAEYVARDTVAPGDSWEADINEAARNLQKAEAHTRGPTLDFAVIPLRSAVAELNAVADAAARAGGLLR